MGRSRAGGAPRQGNGIVSSARGGRKRKAPPTKSDGIRRNRTVFRAVSAIGFGLASTVQPNARTMLADASKPRGSAP